MLLLAALLSLFTIGHAKEEPLKISPVEQVPSAIRASLPEDGKTWFFGKAPAEFRNRETWLHFYNIPSHNPRQKPSLVNADIFYPDRYVLDLWERDTTKRPAKFRRFNSGQIRDEKIISGILTTTASMLWLRDSTRQTPILLLSVLVGNGVNASTGGADFLFVFRHGANNPPAAQHFINYNEFDAGMSHSYDQTDERGILIINEKSYTRNSVNPAVVTNSQFRWNDEKFVFVKNAIAVLQ